jgi:hypothetical protein
MNAIETKSEAENLNGTPLPADGFMFAAELLRRMAEKNSWEFRLRRHGEQAWRHADRAAIRVSFRDHAEAEAVLVEFIRLAGGALRDHHPSTRLDRLEWEGGSSWEVEIAIYSPLRAAAPALSAEAL